MIRKIRARWTKFLQERQLLKLYSEVNSVYTSRDLLTTDDLVDKTIKLWELIDPIIVANQNLQRAMSHILSIRHVNIIQMIEAIRIINTAVIYEHRDVLEEFGVARFDKQFYIDLDSYFSDDNQLGVSHLETLQMLKSEIMALKDTLETASNKAVRRLTSRTFYDLLVVTRAIIYNTEAN